MDSKTRDLLIDVMQENKQLEASINKLSNILLLVQGIGAIQEVDLGLPDLGQPIPFDIDEHLKRYLADLEKAKTTKADDVNSELTPSDNKVSGRAPKRLHEVVVENRNGCTEG